MKRTFILAAVLSLTVGVCQANELSTGSNYVKSYTLTEVNKIDDNFYDANGHQVFNVITRYDENTPKYYLLTFNNNQYGTGDAEKYFYREESPNGNLIVKETTDKSKAEFIVRYSTDNTSARLENQVGDIVNNFIENELSNKNLDVYGAAIYNKDNNTGNITGDFIGNIIDTSQKGFGGAIYNANGIIESINGNFAGNHITTKSNYTCGGAIYNTAGGDIKKIEGNFVGNYTSAQSSSTYGGAIYNGSHIYSGVKPSKIGNITGDFIGNYTENQGSDALGGAIFNNNDSEIGNITGNFTGNYSYNTAKSYGKSRGGAIYNEKGSIADITGDFIENYSKSTVGNSMGGAIYSENGNINDIKGDFIGNYVYGVGSAGSYGGAITNYAAVAKPGTGVINSISGDFIDNYVVDDAYANGGAIYNRAGATINNITGTFSGNKVIIRQAGKGYSSGGAIYNAGTMTITDSQFYNNSVDSKTAMGGAIYNRNAILNIVADKKDVVFSGNKTNGVSNAIHNHGNWGNATINLNAGDKKIIVNDAITGGVSDEENDTATININKQDIRPTSGVVEFNNLVSGNNINIYDGTLKLGSYIDVDGNKSYGNFNDTVKLSLNGGTLSLINDEISHDYNVGTLIANGGKLSIDVNLAGTDDSDQITIGNFEANEKIGFTDINILGDVSKESGTVTVLNNASGQIFSDYSVITSKNTISFTDGGNGTLNYIKSNVGGIKASIDYTGGDRTYNLDTTEVVKENLGNIAGDNSTLTINGNSNTLDGKGFSGIGVSNGQTLVLNDVKVENFAGIGNGGAIENTGTLDISNVTFNNNSVNGISNAIYNEGTINLNSGKIVLNDSVTGNGGTINVNDGIIQMNKTVSDNSIMMNNGVLQLNGILGSNTNFAYNSGLVTLQNNAVNSVNFGNLTLNNDMNLQLDANLATQTMDKISANSFTSNGNKINVSNINILQPTTQKFMSISPIASDGDAEANEAIADSIVYTGSTVAYSPIYKYDVDYQNGMFNFGLIGGGSSPNDYNPSVLATPVALQAQVQSGLRESMNYSFEHMDTFTKLPLEKRLARINSDKYAITEFNEQMPLQGSVNENAFWFRPYTVFESMDLHGGPKVDNITYGTLMGFDSKFRELKHGWASVSSAYLGYNGSSMGYDNVDIISNGGLIGLTQTYYKKNFWTAISASAGASVGTINTMYGSDDVASLNTGITSKTGYNFEFKEGRFIIQPMISLSYYFANIFDYTNSAGVKINSDPLNSFEIKPGIRFVGNTKNGWQPYMSVVMVWNEFGSTRVKADGVNLPHMSLRPYIEYGLGLQRMWDENFTCYLQSMVRNGSRNGVAVTFGLRWNVGRNKKEVL